MATQTFPVGEAPRIVLSGCAGDLEIEVWDERAVEVETDGAVRRLGQAAEALVIESAEDDLRLRVPADAEVLIEDLDGDLTASGFRALTGSNLSGDVELKDIGGPMRLENVSGGIEAHTAEQLTVAGELGGDVELHGVGVVEIEQVGGDFHAVDSQSVTVSNVGGDCEINAAEVVRYGNIGGDLQIEGSARTVVAGGSAGGDVSIQQAASVQIGDAGGDCEIRSVAGELSLGSVGGDCEIGEVAGTLRLGNVGGDANVHAQSAGVQIGTVGGDLHLASAFPPESSARVTVGGDALIELPREANLTIRATVGGDVSGERLVSTGGGLFSAVYGEGAARLDILVGGDLRLSGGGAPRSSTSSWSSWAEFGEEMSRMGQELGREFSQMGEELGRELSGAFGSHGRHGGDKWARKVQKQVEERVRRAEASARRAEERARHGEDRARRGQEAAGRIHVRINDREWRFDPDRLDRLKQQAAEAARSGISGAMEAMERALAGLGVPPPVPPVPPVPPAPSSGPVPPAPPAAPMPPAPAWPASTGATIKIDALPTGQPDPAEQHASPAAEPPRNVEEERAAILQMVAEGRISPEEGDMLLDALG
jgi:hypothetical protein